MLPLGTQFKNSASIYFDYNAPVKTNQTVNTIGTLPTSVKNVASATITSAFKIYPNPANSSFNAVIDCVKEGNASMSINDVSGRAIISRNITVQKGMQTMTIDISQVAAGVYFVNFVQDGKLQTQKLVVVKS